MSAFLCNTCNAEFHEDAAQKLHYRSDWHQYNLRRKVAGVPGVSETLFNARLEALAAEKRKLAGEPLIYKCSVCGKEYRSAKAHAQHVRSKLHIQKAAGVSCTSDDEITVTRPAPNRTLQAEHDGGSEKAVLRAPQLDAHGSQSKADSLKEEDSDDDWEEIDEDEMSDGSHEIDGQGGTMKMSEEDEDDWDAAKCFICDMIPDGSVEGCVEHLHKMHGFFIPDAEYLKDPRGLLSYLGLKVTRGFTCLYCDDRGKQFQSLEAVRKHMISKSHCKLQFGDEGVEEELEDFYDFSSSYMMEDDSQMVSVDAAIAAPVSLSTLGSELIIRPQSGKSKTVKVLGSREFARYYKQRPRPSDKRDGVLVNALVARYRSMGLATRQPPGMISSFKETKKLPHFRAEVMRTKLGIKNNILNNLPKNVPY